MTRSLLLLALCALAGAAHAETVNCTPITSLPVTLSTQGVYCLKQDLSTPITSGNAITVSVNNVTIDCNGYKLGGLAAGDATRANGIHAADRNNTVVRNCNVRGFYAGIWFQGGAGHIAEGNRLENNTYVGIGVFGSDGDLVRDNFIVDTGGNLPTGTFPFGAAFGIGGQNATGLMLVGNTILDTHATTASARPAYGIGLFDSVGMVEGNRISQVMADGAASSYGVMLTNATTRMVVRGNSAINATSTPGWAVTVTGGAGAVLQDNLGKNFDDGIVGGSNAGGNYAD
jgi:parallel beta-helix repeat protein